jgi:ABC-type transporter Mla subunit MlaD
MEQSEKTSMNAAEVADNLARATEALAETLSNLNGQFAAIHAKIDRIVAAIDDGELNPRMHASASEQSSLHDKVAELEKSNQELRAQSATARRKTLSPVVTALLAKEGVDGEAVIETPIVEKALAALSIEQRIAVKAELARAGILV